jgi:hypothetical protein
MLFCRKSLMFICSDNSVFISATRHLPENVGKAAAEAGLPVTSIKDFVTNLLSQNATGLPLVPGITPDIIQAGAGALLDTYTTGFRNVWVTAVAFTVLALIGMFCLPNFFSVTNLSF